VSDFEQTAFDHTIFSIRIQTPLLLAQAQLRRGKMWRTLDAPQMPAADL
jgi:hypothetical protein